MLAKASLFERLSARSRAQKHALLPQLLQAYRAPAVLDLGGQVESIGPLLGALPSGATVTAVNIMTKHVRSIRKQFPQVRTLIGDASQLPFADQSFDLVYSNAVIEHLGTAAAQERMAREIQRVGRSWFVTTPNRWFPFDFHTRMPLLSWLPAQGLRRLARLYSYNHVHRRYMTGCDHSDLRLLDAGKLRHFFPTSRLIKNRVTFWPETLIVVGNGDGR